MTRFMLTNMAVGVIKEAVEAAAVEVLETEAAEEVTMGGLEEVTEMEEADSAVVAVWVAQEALEAVAVP